MIFPKIYIKDFTKLIISAGIRQILYHVQMRYKKYPRDL